MISCILVKRPVVFLLYTGIIYSLLFASLTSAETSTCPQITEYLQRGSSSTQVVSLKRYLNGQGLLSGVTFSTYFGKTTEAALKRWQSQRGIEPTGATGPKTRRALSQCSEEIVASSQCPNITRSLSRGMRGSDVTNLQRYLVSLTLLSQDSVTGHYGLLTEQAVKRFQASKNLEQTGVVGPLTQAALRNCTASAQTTSTMGAAGAGANTPANTSANTPTNAQSNAQSNTASGYTLPYVSPQAILPSFVSFGAGSFENDSMPDTLDLTQHAKLSINALTSPLLAEADYDHFWFANLNANPMRLDMGSWERMLPQFWATLQWMRYMTGDTTNLAVDQVWQNRHVKSLAPSGSLSFSIYKSYIPNVFDITNYRNIGAQFINDIYSQDWALFAFANLYRQTGDNGWKNKGIALVADLAVHGVYCDGSGAYGSFCYVVAPAYTDTYKDEQGRVHTGAPSSELGGRLIIGMSNFYAATGHVPARELAQKFVNYLINYGGYFNRSTGAFIRDQHASDEARGTHVGRHTQALVALADYAILTDDQSVVQFVINSFNWLKSAKCDDNQNINCTNTTIGWFPEFLDSTWPTSDYAVADMIQVAVKLSAAGKADLWDDAERWARNQFSAQQLDDVSWLPGFSSQFSNMETSGSACGAVSSSLFCSTNNVGQRVLGAWGGFVRPNEFLPHVTTTGGRGVMGDSTAWGSMTVYTLWKHSITRSSDYLKVNMLFNRTSEWANVYSYIPYTGRVDVKIKDASIQKLYIRIPQWTTASQATVTKAGTSVPLYLTEGYAYVAGPFQNGQIISITFPISERTETFALASTYGSQTKTTFEFTLRGDMVIQVSPQGQRGAFYTDRLRYRNAAQMKSTQNFIPSSRALLNDYPAPSAPPVPTTPTTPTTPATPVLHVYGNGTEGAITVPTGQSVNITWSAQNVDGCTLYGPQASPFDSTNIFNGSGQLIVPSPGQATGPIMTQSVYTFRCVKNGVWTGKTLTITPATPGLNLYGNGTEGTITVPTGQSVNLTWSAQNVVGCNVYGPKASPLDTTNLFNSSGLTNVPSPGQATGPITMQAIYTLRCINGGNIWTSKTITINPTNPVTPSTSTFIHANGQPDAITVPSGSTVGISWGAQNVKGCAVYGPNASPLNDTNVFNGSGYTHVPAPGQTTNPITSRATFTLRCVDTNDALVVEKTVVVTPQ